MHKFSNNMNENARETIEAIANTCERELDWLNRVLERTIRIYFEQDGDNSTEVIPPNLDSDSSVYANLIHEYSMGFNERLILILSLIPYIRPQLLDLLFIQNKNFDIGYTEFGGYRGETHRGFLPTCETAMFILASKDLSLRFELQELFNPNHYFTKDNILSISEVQYLEPRLSAKLRPGKRMLDIFPWF